MAEKDQLILNSVTEHYSLMLTYTAGYESVSKFYLHTISTEAS